MDAIVTTGGIPRPGQALFTHTYGRPKAFLEVGGKPLLQWVLDALGGARHVQRIVVVGSDLGPEIGCAKPLTFLAPQGRMVDNMMAGMIQSLAANPAANYFLLCASDLPYLTAATIDWLVETSLQTQHDAYYPVVTRQTMEARFPEHLRQYLRLKDMELTGAAVGVVSADLLDYDLGFWARLEADRKSTVRQALNFGLANLLGILLRRFTMEQLAQRVAHRVGISARAILSPYAELAYDVDDDRDLGYLRQHPPPLPS